MRDSDIPDMGKTTTHPDYVARHHNIQPVAGGLGVVHVLLQDFHRYIALRKCCCHHPVRDNGVTHDGGSHGPLIKEHEHLLHTL